MVKGPDAAVTIVGLPDAACASHASEFVRRFKTAATSFRFKRRRSIWRLLTCEKRAQALICQLRWGFSARTVILRKQTNLIHILCVGELSLDGRVRAIKGALPIAILAREG